MTESSWNPGVWETQTADAVALSAIDIKKNKNSIDNLVTVDTGTGIFMNPLALGTTWDAVHHLGGAPNYVRARLTCLTEDLDYAVGAVLDISGSTNVMSVFVTGTEIGLRVVSVAPNLIHATTGVLTAITPGSWQLILTPYRFG